MIENHRSGLLWSHFMANPEIQPALDAIGFVEDLVSNNEPDAARIDWSVYPTISRGELFIQLEKGWSSTSYQFMITDMLGRNVSFDHESIDDQITRITFPHAAGWVWVTLMEDHQPVSTAQVWVR
jgi:hypothetical protein